jgi:hypothetical protein
VSILTISILLVNLRLELILIRSNGRRAAHTLQLARHVVVDVFFIAGISGATTTTAGMTTTTADTTTSTGLLVVEDG